MKKKLTKYSEKLYIMIDGKSVYITDDNKEEYGIRGNISDIYGDVSGIYGDVSGIRGNISGIRGDVDVCEITAEDKEIGINITDLINK